MPKRARNITDEPIRLPDPRDAENIHRSPEEWIVVEPQAFLPSDLAQKYVTEIGQMDGFRLEDAPTASSTTQTSKPAESGKDGDS